MLGYRLDITVEVLMKVNEEMPYDLNEIDS